MKEKPPFLLCKIREELLEFSKMIRLQLLEYGLQINEIQSGWDEVDFELNDKNISHRDVIKTSYGRYKFKEQDVWRKYYIPYSDYPGVYLFFEGDVDATVDASSNDLALYVGKSESAVGYRIASHLGNYNDAEFENEEFNKADYVVVIPFIEAPFLAVAFESHLLSKYEFKLNIIGQ